MLFHVNYKHYDLRTMNYQITCLQDNNIKAQSH